MNFIKDVKLIFIFNRHSVLLNNICDLLIILTSTNCNSSLNTLKIHNINLEICQNFIVAHPGQKFFKLDHQNAIFQEAI